MKRFLLLLLLASCARHAGQDELLSISLVDRNGFSESISIKDRLDLFRDVDFCEPQPYEKVVRVFGGDEISSTITTYYPNGELRQLLHVRGGRAFGPYREYWSNGQLKVEGNLIGGPPEVDEAAQVGWIFDGVARAFDEEGHLLAHVPYCKGELDGLFTEYFPYGQLKASIPYVRGEIEGVAERWFASGELAWQASYADGALDGLSRSWWGPDQFACEEQFRRGLLEEGHYYNQEGLLEEEVVRGSGFRVSINEEGCKEVHQVRDGLPSGTVKKYGDRGQLLSLYHVVEGQKVGEEIFYFDPPFATEEEVRATSPIPKLSIRWHGGEIQGEVKSWYSNGQLESQREMSRNRRNGVSTAWYGDGSLMMIEEYSEDRLVKGEYFRKGSSQPVSEVQNGEGIASLFDQGGFLIRKVRYLEGEPDEG